MRNHHYFGESTRQNETLRVLTSRSSLALNTLSCYRSESLKRLAISGTLNDAGADLPRAAARRRLLVFSFMKLSLN